MPPRRRLSAPPSAHGALSQVRLKRPVDTSRFATHAPRTATLAAAGVVLAAAAWTAARPQDGGLSLLLVALGMVAFLVAWLESGPGAAREVALVATLAGAAAAGRVLFAAVPGVQPVTVIAVATGAALGLRAGVGVGATAALASNFLLGQGPWTPWQMLGWAGCGALGALLPPLLRRRVPFAAVCCIAGFAFSGLMDLWEWFSFYPHTWQALSVQMGRGLWFDAAHAAGNVVLALVAGPELRRLLERYARRLRTEIVWAS
jgi:energy-coupling factor transport system substrate-specific component